MNNTIDNNIQYFSGYASVFNVLDKSNEVILPNAFKNLNPLKNNIPLLWQHNYSNPIGKILYAKQDEVGLFTIGIVDLNTSFGREALSLIKNNAIYGLSIGYEDVKMRNGENREKELSVINNLLEISIVTFPINEMTYIKLISSEVEKKKILKIIYN